MFFSIYPTDEETVKNEVIAQAIKYKVLHFFTSLHIPEAQFMFDFITQLKELHNMHQFTYTADIGPETLTHLNVTFEDLSILKDTGITGLRLDYGIDFKLIDKLKEQDFEISMNASTITKDLLDNLNGTDIIGWHNYYPRPFTGISTSYFKSQNKLLRKYQSNIKAFVPGEKYKRLPLCLGLPTLEKHREQNSYISYLELKKKYEIDDVGIAEGILCEDSMNKIIKYELEKIVTIPVNCQKEVETALLNQPFKVRIEQTDFSWRLEGTRNIFDKDAAFYLNEPDTVTEYGGIYADGNHYERYKGEVHICTTKKGIPMKLHKIGIVKKDFLPIIPMLSNSPKIQFEL